MNKIKRSLAILLIIGLVVTGMPLNMAKATESNTVIDEDTNITVVDDNQTDSDIATDDEKDETTIEGEAKTTDEGTNDVTESEEDFVDIQLNYIYVESPKVTTPGEQNIVVSLGDASDEITNVKLNYQKDNGEIKSWDSSDSADGAFLFSSGFTDADSGIYDIVSVSFEVNGKSQEIILNEMGHEAHFGVNEDYTADTNEALEVQEDGSLEEKTDEGDSDINESNAVVEADGTDMEAISNDVKQAIKSQVPTATLSRSATAKSGNLIVYLDPGHDASHPGAHANGLKEEELTLKIAKYCKAELEKYSGITVKMTRSSSACPYPGTDSGDCLDKRIQNAIKGGADAYVSIHLNSVDSSSANGAEVWYWYNNSEGHKLAQKVQDQLVALGLKDRGEKGDDPAVGGSSYAVTRECNKAGIPGIIIEHAFITGSTDSKFLKSETNLKKLGVADATGIVKTYSLSKSTWTAPKLENTTATENGIEVQWGAVSGANGYAVYRKTGSADWVLLDTVKSTSYTDITKLTNGTTYYYTVRAYKGSEEDALKHKYEEKYWTNFDHTGIKVIGINTPKLKSTETAEGGIKVCWEAVSGANGYAVYKNISGNSWQIIGQE